MEYERERRIKGVLSIMKALVGSCYFELMEGNLKIFTWIGLRGLWNETYR